MEKYIAVAIGGAVGALCRMALGEWVMTKVSSFPYGTVVVNLIGCLIIGLVLGLCKSQIYRSWRDFSSLLVDSVHLQHFQPLPLKCYNS